MPRLFGISGNDADRQWLVDMTSLEIAKPLVRALKIYRRVTRHDLDQRMRRDLARHIRRLAEQGVRDQDRLTVHGLSYLQKLERESGSH